MVGAPPLLLEWKKLNHTVSIHDNYIRCFPSGLGSHLQWQSDQRSVVPFQTIPTHQLSGTSSCYTSSSDLCQGDRSLASQFSCDSTTAYINRRWGTASPRLSLLVKDLWLWCTGRNILLQAQHLPGVLNTIVDE